MERNIAVRLSARVDQYVAAMEKARSATNRLSSESERNLKKLGGDMQRVGGQMTRRVTLPLVGVGVASVKMAADFEGSLAKVTALVGVGADEVAGMRDRVLELAGETAQAPRKLADALFFITSAGLRGKDALAALEFSAKASAAGLGDVAVVADVVTSAMNAYGPEILNAEQATDILIGTVREGKAEAPELAASLGTVLPVASALGIKFDEVGATMAAMTRTGTNAATAGTQLNAVMTGLLKPTPQAESALRGVGLSSQGLRDRLAEPGGLLAVLLMLRDRFGDNEAAMAEVFPNVRALRGVLDLLGAQGETNAQIFERMTDTVGLTGTAFDTMAKTDAFKARQALADVQVAAVQIGVILAPLATDILGFVSRVAKAFTELPSGVQGSILVFGAFVAAVGPALIVVGSLIKNLALLRTELAASNLSAMIGPLGLIAAAVGVAAGAYLLLRDRSDDVATSFDTQRTAAKSLREELEKGADPTATILARFRELALETPSLVSAMKGAGLSFSDLVDEANGIAVSGGSVVHTLMDAAAAAGMTDTEVDALGTSVSGLILGYRDAVAVVGDVNALTTDTGAIMGDVAGSTDDAGDAAFDYAADLDRQNERLEEARDLLREHIDALKDQIDAHLRAADATFALHDAEDGFAEAVERLTTVMGDNESTLAEVRQAQDAVAESAARTANAHLRVAEETAAMSGAALTATQRIDIMNGSLIQQAAQTNGPARTAILNYIAAINGIPPNRVTQIEALLDEGKISSAEAVLQLTSRTRHTAIGVDADTATAENDINWTARDRSATIRAYYQEIGGPSAPTVQPSYGGPRAVGGTTRAGMFYDVLEGGRSELYTEGGRTWLMAARDGVVTPLSSGGTGGFVTGGTSVTADEIARAVAEAFPSEMVLEVDGRQMTAHVRGVIREDEREKAGAM